MKLATPDRLVNSFLTLELDPLCPIGPRKAISLVVRTGYTQSLAVQEMRVFDQLLDGRLILPWLSLITGVPLGES